MVNAVLQEETDDEGAVLPNPDGGGGPFYVDKVRIVGLPKGEGFPTTVRTSPPHLAPRRTTSLSLKCGRRARS